MNITYKNPGDCHSIESISLFLTGDETAFWSAPMLHFYPQLDPKMLAAYSPSDKQKYLSDVFGNIYSDLKEEIDRKVICYNDHFQRHKQQIEHALSDAFHLDASCVFNDLTGNVTLNPVCPRYLKEHCFDVFYMNSERGALGFVSTLFVTNQYVLLVSYAFIGAAWAAMLAVPFTILTNSLKGDNMGYYLGLFNCTICLPQIVAALIGGAILKYICAGSQVGMLVAAGVLLILGAISVVLIKEGKK